MNNVGKDGVLACGMQCIRVGFYIGTRCNAEEAVFRIDSPQTSILTDSHPSDVVKMCIRDRVVIKLTKINEKRKMKEVIV